MAIYRGPGGAGDATGDATNASALALAAKNEAQASATSAASSATAAASSASAASTSASDASTSATNAAGSATTASTAATNASTYATNASDSADEAAASASDAADSATAAASSATSASTDASTASTQASNASSSASSASTSASTATTKASEAATSATNAASSASAAATSETNAASSASAAATSETNAASSASSASTSASTATTKASEASSSASSASTSASTATTQASNAASSASAASTSASNASTSATNAASSASSAASSAASAAAALDSFDDRYLGSKTSDPTLDNDGNALATGALYYNSTDGEMRVYDGSQWIAASAASQAILTKYKYVATAGQTTFSGTDANALTLAYTVGSIIVTLNGVVMDAADYTATTGTSVVLGAAASLNDELCVLSFSTFDVANTYTQAQADARYLNLAGGTLTGDVRLNNGSADGAQFQLASSGYSDWNLDNYSGRLRAYYGSTEYMTITAAGNVGIGTSSPAEKCHIYASSGNAFYKFQNAATGSGASDGGFMGIGGSGDVFLYNYEASNLIFATNNSERARIDSSGNLLVGTTSTLGASGAGNTHIAGSNSQPLYLRNTAATAGKYWRVGPDSSSNTFTVYNQGNATGVYLTDGGTSWTGVSDERLKTTLTPFENAAEKVCTLRTGTGRYLTDDESVSRSFLIAQDVQKVLPEAVNVQSDEQGTLGLQYTDVIPLLVAAIQEQQAQISSQAAVITTLTERITALEAK